MVKSLIFLIYGDIKTVRCLARCGEITQKERSAFDSASIKCYNENTDSININRAEKSAFIVQILSEEELSNFTHCMNLWKSKEPRIMRRERNVSLAEEDFNESDAKLISALDDLYH